MSEAENVLNKLRQKFEVDLRDSQNARREAITKLNVADAEIIRAHAALDRIDDELRKLKPQGGK